MFCPFYAWGKKRKGLFCLIPSLETFNSHKLTSGNAAHMKTLQHLCADPTKFKNEKHY